MVIINYRKVRNNPATKTTATYLRRKHRRKSNLSNRGDGIFARYDPLQVKREARIGANETVFKSGELMDHLQIPQELYELEKLTKYKTSRFHFDKQLEVVSKTAKRRSLANLNNQIRPYRGLRTD